MSIDVYAISLYYTLCESISLTSVQCQREDDLLQFGWS